MTKIEVVADTANGIQKVSAYEYGAPVVSLGFSDFCDALKNMADGEAYSCRLTQAQYDLLSEEYGIH